MRITDTDIFQSSLDVLPVVPVYDDFLHLLQAALGPLHLVPEQAIEVIAGQMALAFVFAELVGVPELHDAL